MERRIAFLWEGVKYHYGQRWKDGLWLAMKRLEEKYRIRYFEPDDETGIYGFNPDVILFWGALSEDVKPLVTEYPFPKAICFAGGAIDKNNVDGFDLYFTESEVNEVEFKNFGKPYLRAFGVNERIYKPLNLKKKYQAMFAGTFALWKRNDLFAKSVDNGVALGLHQDHEKECYKVCEENGIEVLDELPREQVAEYINKSEYVLNTADYWGGGQRLTLEAMACNVPPIVMADSLKNCEYVKEANYGLISEPDVNSIREALTKKVKGVGRKYILSKWTSKHYADNLDKGLKLL